MIGPEFFPTPTVIAYKMLAKIDKDAVNFLEPSAGRGDLAEAIKRRFDRNSVRVDCIESDPDLAAALIAKDLPVVGYDWLDYSGVSYYDAIVMNPPFSNGDDHLLRAWDFMHDGEIVCLLNEQTVLNPHTAARQRLSKIIAENGSIEYLGDCFSSAARKTDARVAMVYLKKTSGDDHIDLWATSTEERAPDDAIGAEENMLAIRDTLGNMQHYYDKANEHMLKAFNHLRKAALYMDANDISVGYDGRDYREILPIALRNVNGARAEFARKHRRDAWFRVFTKMQFNKWLDKKQTEEFLRDVERNGNIPFTAENIKGTLENVIMQRKRLFEQSVANVFDELTRYYAGNTNHTEGWKSNSDYMVNQKLVFPYGCQFRNDSHGGYTWREFKLWYGSSSQIDFYNDLDRVLCVLAGEEFEHCSTIAKVLDARFHALGHHVKAPFDNTCTSRFFEIRFWMKGTVHLKWRDRDLWERFNVAASAGKKWVGRGTKGNAA